MIRGYKSLRYWRNITLVTVSAVLVLVIVAAVYVVVMVARAAENALAPPRIPLDGTPGDVGIAAYEDVAFTADDGIVLRGWYMPPAPQNATVIILAHGYAHNRLMLLPEASVLVGQGHGALLFDFRGHGESDPALVTIGDHERRDLSAAIDYVAARPGVSRIGALGFSMGAATLAQVAAEDDRLGAVVLEAAFPVLSEDIRYRSRVFGVLSQVPALRTMRRAGVDVDGVRPIDDLCAIAPRPLLLVFGEWDADVPPGTPQAMHNAACDPVDLWIVAGAGHQNYSEVVPDEYAAKLLRFFGGTW